MAKYLWSRKHIERWLSDMMEDLGEILEKGTPEQRYYQISADQLQKWRADLDLIICALYDKEKPGD